MLKSLQIDWEWIDQPAALDSLERESWARISITAGGRSVTRIWDRETRTERTGLYIPAFPLVRWLVLNWWSLLSEGVPCETVPVATSLLPEAQKAWVRRHCLRSAESGVLLPRLYLFKSGSEICVQWYSDDRDRYPHMPAVFLENGIELLERANVEDSLSEFVEDVVRKLKGCDDPRYKDLKSDWRAILQADGDEKDFCRFAGQMGLDPYKLSTWAPGLPELLESDLGAKSHAGLVDDFLDSATSPHAVALWKWVERAEEELSLGQTGIEIDSPRALGKTPAQAGYEFASRVRQSASLGELPVRSLSELASTMGAGGLVLTSLNHLPEPRVRAMVGFGKSRQFEIVGPTPPNQSNQRFLQARALYYALGPLTEGPRLITTAHGWDQKASRAFAAELLAPAKALLESVQDAQVQEKTISALAKKYRVSPKVIELQLQNSNVDIVPF